ncbi:MAG: type II toxin-antitoxin system RelE/ParE family toxin [Chloroflexi bacterium]|nr:type II toxin-antitoxin system RelE/ParE family toxin [Chloroflexota bacterium]
MVSYKVTVDSSAEKELQGLDKSVIPKVWEQVKSLENDARPLQSKKIKGTAKGYRLRFRDYRIIYNVDDKARSVEVVAIRHRKDAYR